jgi:hypothetical protein
LQFVQQSICNFSGTPIGAKGLISLATPPGFEPGTFSLEGYEETLYYQRPVILFRSENWPIAQLKYHRTPSQLWTADRTRGDSWRASDFSAFRRGPQPRLPPPVPLPSSRTGGQTNVLRPGCRGAKGGSALRGTKPGAIPSTILRASLVSNAIATVALGHLHHRVEPGRDLRWHQLGDLAGISVPLVGRQVFSRHDLPPFHRHPLVLRLV